MRLPASPFPPTSTTINTEAARSSQGTLLLLVASSVEKTRHAGLRREEENGP